MPLPRFKVEIRGEGLEQARESLNAAGVPTIGPASAGRSGAPWTATSDSMYAILEALSPEEAEARVREALPDGDYTVSPAEPLPAWRIVGVDDLEREGDAQVYRWILEQGDGPAFTDVKITGNALAKGDDMTERSIKAVETNGRSEVELYLGDPQPPLLIEVGTQLDPRVTKRQ